MQVPRSAKELRELLDAGALVEGLELDVKAILTDSVRGNADLAIDLAAMSVAGGLIIIGVEELGDRLVPSPVSLVGLRERVGQVGLSRVDPPVSVTTVELPDEGGERTGFLVIIIPRSPDAPHQVDHRYRGRTDSTNSILSDGEVRRVWANRDLGSADVRAALLEQLDNCRAWQGRDPARGEPAWVRLRQAPPRVEAIRLMIDRVNLQPDVAAFLLWQIAAIGELWPRIEGTLDGLARTPNGLSNPALQALLRDLWTVMLERLQVATALVASEAQRRGLRDLALTHDGVAWTAVPERPPTWRRDMAIADRHAGIPSFPTDSAFVGVTPEARDLAGHATGARQRADLHDAMSPQVRKLLRR